MPFFGQTRVNDAVLPDELPRFSQVGGGGGISSFVTIMNYFSDNPTIQIEFYAVQGAVHTGSSTEARTQNNLAYGFTIDLMTFSIDASTTTQASTIRLRVNGIDTSLILNIAAATTGRFQDAVNSHTLVDVDAMAVENDYGVGFGGNYGLVSSSFRIVPT